MTENTRKLLVQLANSENASELYEELYSQIVAEQAADDTPYRKIGCQLVQALIKDDSESVIKAITGWSVEDLLDRAGLCLSNTSVKKAGDTDA